LVKIVFGKIVFGEKKTVLGNNTKTHLKKIRKNMPKKTYEKTYKKHIKKHTKKHIPLLI
jgi:hypothetical protein